MIATLIALSLAVAPQVNDGTDGKPPQRIRNIQLQGSESCPKAEADEIVVCGRADDEQFRIPKQFREAPKQDAPGTSWAVKVDRVMEDNQKVLPGSCSPIGSNGQTGCAQKAAEQWAAERRAKANGQSVEPPK
ncbi:hypothetical protein [Sphingomonas sp.]|uniref:hypothetical protein n=1 Tax=Sphingomonas sp. TaxID=28214 RepID=UPI002C14326D|nr:hypothetical protein [Sphingomonas sp.]HWK36357.1 hypothetical protein [Sphingomonas sp.]